MQLVEFFDTNDVGDYLEALLKFHVANLAMKPFTWDPIKNQQLEESRKITFEQIVKLIQEGNALDIVRHDNPMKHKDQFVLVLEMNDYIWLVPYVSTKTGRFLKTAFPSRKATRKYLRGKND